MNGGRGSDLSVKSSRVQVHGIGAYHFVNLSLLLLQVCSLLPLPTRRRFCYWNGSAAQTN